MSVLPGSLRGTFQHQTHRPAGSRELCFPAASATNHWCRSLTNTNEAVSRAESRPVHRNISVRETERGGSTCFLIITVLQLLFVPLRSFTPTSWCTATTTCWTPRSPTWCPRNWPRSRWWCSTRLITSVRVRHLSARGAFLLTHGTCLLLRQRLYRLHERQHHQTDAGPLSEQRGHTTEHHTQVRDAESHRRPREVT